MWVDCQCSRDFKSKKKSSDKRKDIIVFDDNIEEIQDTITVFTFSLGKSYNCVYESPKLELQGTRLLCRVSLTLQDCRTCYCLEFLNDYENFCIDTPRIQDVSLYDTANQLIRNISIQEETPTDDKRINPYNIAYVKVTVAYKIKAYENISDENETVFSKMKDIYLDEKFTDVIINVEGEEFSAHKVILINNPVFAAMLQNDMLESKTNVIHIRKMDPAIFQIILRFIYFDNTGRINFKKRGEDFLINLIMAADMYQILYLKEELINIAINYIHLENVIKFLIMSDKFNISKLKEECMLYIRNNPDKVVDTLSFQELIKEHLHLTSELLVYVIKNISS